MSTVNQGLPSPGYPFVDSTGKVSPIWFQFLSSLWQRTGGGQNLGNVQSVSVNATNGILASVANPSTTPEISLSLGGISPTSITTNGAVIAASGSFATGLSTAGGMSFGTYQPSSFGQTGYIEIVDNSGIVRRLMVG